MKTLDLGAMASGLFLPMLLWTGSVLSVTLMGYPQVVCMTPAFWALAWMVGRRVRRESQSQGSAPVREAALAGAVLGAWMAVLLALVVAAVPLLLRAWMLDPPGPLLTLLAGLLICTPVTAALAALSARRSG